MLEFIEPRNPEIDILRELAESGALCELCGGVCVPSISVAILLTHAATDSGQRIPWCQCPECRVCAPLREAVLRLRRKK